MKPSLNDFNRGFLQTVLDGLWTQWSALGVPGHAGRVPRAAIDPEALLLLTCSLGRYDARMFDEMLGWIVLHERLLDVQRLKNLLRDEGYAGGCVVSAIGAYLSAAKRGGVKWQRLSAVHAGKTWQPEPLFYSLDGGSISVIREPDLDFARQGLHREKIALRDHAQPFNPDQPVNLRLKLRALFGVNSRAETVTFLLLHDQAGPTEIARATGYFKLTVYNTLAEIRLSGLLQSWEAGGENLHRLKGKFWDAFPRADWVNWAVLFRFYERVWQTLADAARRQMTAPSLAIELHQLEQHIVPLMRRAGLVAEFPRPTADEMEAYVEHFLVELKKLLDPLG